MNVSFYNNTSDNRVVHKNISLIIGPLLCDATETIDISNPTIILDMDESILLSNYMYIPKFNRYYYIQGSTVLNGNQIQVTGRVDVLMSFWDRFKNSPCVAGRSTSDYDNYIDDEYVTIKDTYTTEVRRLQGAFTPTSSGSNHYVLTVGGINE